MRSTLRLRVLSLFALIAAGSVAAIAAGSWLAWRRMPDALPALVVAGLVAAFGCALVVLLVWTLVDQHGARAIARLAAALRARAQCGPGTGLDLADLRHLGDLGPATGALCDRLADAEDRFEVRLTEATRAFEDDNAHLAALLSDIPVAVMLVDAANKVMLYDRQCVHLLGRAAPLCLGRSVFDYLDRDALERALTDLADEGGRRFVDALLPTADRRDGIRARIRPTLQGRGFMLAMEVDDAVLAERPLVFDFNLLDRPADRGVTGTPLSDLAFVVFDTETTGLDTRRDEIVQIGAVRVFNGRVVRGESFETLVDPGRPIPRESSRIHGITDEMVAGAPDVHAALRDFHGFARDAVLVAHNAPFDLSFLKRHEAALGLVFDNPVLDTVLLSAAVFGTTEIHTLDAIADRLNVRIEGATRHTAAGDARVTAEILLRLVGILETRGIRTFDDALHAMRRHSRLLPDSNR